MLSEYLRQKYLLGKNSGKHHETTNQCAVCTGTKWVKWQIGQDARRWAYIP